MGGRAALYYNYARVAFDGHTVSDIYAEPILQVEEIPVAVPNLLVPDPDVVAATTDLNTPARPQLRNCPQSVCRTSNLPPAWIELIRKSPSLLRLLHDTVHCHQTIVKFSLPPINVDMLRHALTVPSAGTGDSYQALEFAGDTVLKICTSVHAYLEFPALDEGRMSTVRQNSVGNRFLRHRSFDSGFASAVLTPLFRPGKSWVPPTSEEAVLSEDGLTMERQVGRKALADTIESTLGAAFLSGGERGLEMALETGEKLGLCFGGTTPWGERLRRRRFLATEPSRHRRT